MTVKTKFEVGDKVGFLTKQFNQEIIGVITQTIISIKPNDVVEIRYEVTSNMVYRILEEQIYLIN